MFAPSLQKVIEKQEVLELLNKRRRFVSVAFTYEVEKLDFNHVQKEAILNWMTGNFRNSESKESNRL